MSDADETTDSGPEETSAPPEKEYKTEAQAQAGENFHHLQRESDYRTTHDGGPQSWPRPGGATPSRWPGGSGGGGGAGASEFEDLATVQRFAQQVVALGEGSDFVQVIKGCGTLHEMIRDFGGDMNRTVREFVEAAIRVERDGIALRDQAAQVANLAGDLSGAGV